MNKKRLRKNKLFLSIKYRTDIFGNIIKLQRKYNYCYHMELMMYFYNPNKFIDYSTKDKDTSYNFLWFNAKPEIGDLIIFPSWLSHGSGGEIA